IASSVGQLCYLATILLSDNNQQPASDKRTLSVIASVVKQSTRRDTVLQNLQRYLHNKWLQNRTDGDMKQYFKRRDCLSTAISCILFGERVTVPSSLRARVLRQFHRDHFDIIRMRPLALS
ncbi:uncharacterized protein DEA37_0000735, partial [Paragonimus westermani]